MALPVDVELALESMKDDALLVFALVVAAVAAVYAMKFIARAIIGSAVIGAVNDFRDSKGHW